MRSHLTRFARVRAERATRRAVRAAGVIAAAAVLLGATAVVALPAEAATPAMSLRTVGGDAQITAAWNGIRGATGYTVHWGSGSATNRTLHTRGTTIRIGGVTNRATYSVRVTADRTASASQRLTVRPVPYIPTSVSAVRAVPAGPNQVRVTWRGGTQARSVSVIAGADSMTRQHHIASAWYPAAVQSITITIPAALRDVLGAGSGNAVFVKVALSNKPVANPFRHLTFSLADRYRVSPSGTWSIAGAERVNQPVTKISVASWNVQSITASAGFSPQNQWAARLPRVVANIQSIHPDLIGLQELTTARVVPGCLNHGGGYQCQEQYQTLQDALRHTPIAYRNVREDANAWLYQQHGPVYVDSALFYNPGKLTVLESGFLSPRALLGSRWPTSATDEVGMWAKFATVPSTGRPSRVFYAASLHLPAGGPTVGLIRSAEAAAAAAHMSAMANGLPVVFTGDFNGNGAMDASAGSLRLRAAGYIDAAATTDRDGYYYSSSNGTNGSDGPDDGYPVHAQRHPYPTSRIDYIMIQNSPFTYRYRNEVRLVPHTTLFDRRYQGSDHNMQFAIVGIAGPVVS